MTFQGTLGLIFATFGNGGQILKGQGLFWPARSLFSVAVLEMNIREIKWKCSATATNDCAQARAIENIL